MGLLSWEEAESGTIPMGDLEGQRGFEESQRWTAPVAPGLDAPARERTWGDVWDANTLRIDQSVQGFQTELDASNLEYAEQVDAASRTPIMGTFGSRMRERFSNPVDLVNPLRVVENTTAAITDTVRAETAAALHSEQELENLRRAASESLNNNIRQMEEVSAALATIPNSEDMLDYQAAMAEGDYLRAAWNLPGATAQVLGEQAIPLLSAAAVTGTTYYFTRNPKATATAARVAAVGMSGMEYGSDLAQLWDEVPEDQRTYEKFKEVQQIARQSAGARALIETALPGFGAKIGNTAMRRATAELGLQMAAGGLGEDISNRIRSGTGEGLYSRLITGEGASAADIVLEAAADAAGVVVEAGPTLRNAAREDAQDAYAQSRIAQVNREFASELQAFRDMQAQAEANRAVFDAEAAAEEAVRSLANREFFDNATQGELPIGSGFGGNTSERGLSDPVTGEPGPILVDDAGNPLPNPGRILRDGNDRVPTSVDMFSGESRPAQKVEERAQAGRAANNPRTGSLYGTERPENDVEFEERKQREEIARRQVADRKERSEQDAFEAQKAEEERARAQVAEDATVLKNEKTLLSSRDIRAEAERLLAIEQEGLRAQRRGIANTPAKMQSLLDAYGRKRLPELIDIVRRRRNKLVTDARKRDIARENEKLRRENAERAWREFAGAARPLSGGTPPHSMGVADEVRDMTGLLRLMPQPEPTQQGTLDLTTRSEQGDLFGGAVPEGTGYTGTLTDAQRAEEAAALAARRRSTLTERARRAEEESKKAEARKAEEEEALSKELEAEIGPIEQALNERATLTQKAYAKKEKAARKKIVDEYVNENPNVPRDRAVREIARRVAAWKAENPPPAGLAAEASADPLVKQAQQVASRTETTKKQQETKATNKALEREIKRGATPEEAAEIVRNRRLSPEEDAAVRRGLRRGRLSNRTEPTTDTNSAAVPEGWGMVDNLPREQRYVKDALDKELASRNPKLSNVLRAIANNSKEAKGYRWLAAKLAPLVDNLGVKLAPWDLPDRKAGVFISSRNEVQINLPLPLTVLHEALHAVTVQLMTSNVGRRNPRVAAAVAQLDAVLAVVRRHMASNPGGAPSVMASATENTRELLAYGLTDGDVLSYLASIPMPGRGISNAWQGFKNAIAHIFNPRTSDQRTALDAVIEATGAIVEAQEQNPGLNEVARTERLRTSQRGDRNFQTIPGGLEANSQLTLEEAMGRFSAVGEALRRTQSVLNRNPTEGEREFLHAAFNTSLGEMAERSIANGNSTAYKQWLGKMGRNFAAWAGLDNKLTLENGVIMPLFHGTAVEGGNAYSEYRMPSSSGQLGIHATPAPYVATQFNRDSRDNNLLYMWVGRMANPLRLTDYGIWGIREVQRSVRKAMLAARTQATRIPLMRLYDNLSSVLANNGDYAADAEVRDAILDAGYDGVVYLNRGEMGDSGLLSPRVRLSRLNTNARAQHLRDAFYGAYGLPVGSTGREASGRIYEWLASITDEDFKLLYPEAVESYIFLRPGDIKSLAGNSGEFTSSTDMYFADGEGGVALTDPEVGFTNPITTRSFKTISVLGKELLKFDPSKYNSIPRIAGTIVDWMTAGMGSSRRTTEILERAQTEAGAISGKAENLYRSIDTNLNRQASAANRNAKEYRDEFISKVTAFEEETAPRRKLALGRALRDTYGKAGRDYLRMRRSIDAMSRRILNNRLASDVPFTEGEAEIYQHIKANLGKYYTRIYASNTRKLADQRANRLLSAYRKVAAGAEDADLMDEYEIVRDAVEFMRDEFLYIPDREHLEGLTSARLKRLADAWGVKLRGVPDIDTPILTAEIKEQLIDALEAFVESTPRAREQQGMVVVERLLTDKSGSSLVNYFRGAREDRTIVTKREAVPPVIRKLLGEFDDPFISGMLTMVNQAQYIAHIKAINELMEVEYGERIMSNDDFVESGLSPQDWRQLTGDSYGPLEGTWVREDLADRIEDTVSIEQSFTKALALAADQPTGLVSAALSFAGRQWVRLAGALKALQLVWNPANLMLNYLGGSGILLSNGNFNLKTVAKAHRTAWKLIQTARAEGRTDADVDEVIRAGITDSAIMGEIRGAELDQLRAVTLEAMQSPVERGFEGGRRRWRSSKRGWRETYAMADVVWKIANYYAEKEHLTALNKEEGTGLTAEQIEREAAVRTNLTNFSFKRVPNLIKALEKGGITYIFPYIYETFRAPVGSILLGLNDIRQAGNAATPEGKARMLRHGLMRTAGATAALGGVQALVYMAIKAMAGEDEDDEEWMEALKVLLPDYKQLGEYVYAGRDDQGRPVLIELSRADPMGPATELYKLMYRAATTEEVDAEDVAKQAWELVIANPYGSTIVKGLLGTASSNTRLESMDPTNYDRIVSSFSDPDTGMRVAKVLDAFIPSWYARALDPNNRAPDDQMILDVAGWMGMQLVKADPETSLKYAASNFALERSDVRADFLNFLQRGERSDEEIAREFLALQEREAEAFEELDNLFVGMLRLGYDQGYVLSELKARKVGEADLRLLASGTYGIENSGILSMASMEASWANAERQPTSQWSDAKKERYLDNLRRVVGLIEQGRLPARR